MKIALKYGIAVTLIIAAWVALKHFVLHFEGPSAQLADLAVFNLSAIVALMFGIKEKRVANGDSLTFFDGFKTGGVNRDHLRGCSPACISFFCSLWRDRRLCSRRARQVTSRRSLECQLASLYSAQSFPQSFRWCCASEHSSAKLQNRER